MKTDSFFSAYLVTALLSGIFFLFITIRNSPVKSKFVAVSSLVPAFWCTMRMIIEYRDLTGFMNKALYTGQFLFIISALIFFLYEADLLLGEDAITKPNSYAFFGVSTVFFGLSARLPHLIASFGGRIALDLLGFTSLAADLTITFFVLMKLVSFVKKD